VKGVKSRPLEILFVCGERFFLFFSSVFFFFFTAWQQKDAGLDSMGRRTS
jgi:hypothetical protein